MNFWDEQFSAAGYKYGTQPNAFLRQQVHRIAAGGRILVPGDGEGRNSVWLARQGFEVTAMDGSQVGLDKGQALAAERQVAVRPVLADLNTWVPESASYDAVVLTFVHLPSPLRTHAHQRLAQALRQGGVMLLEAFHPTQLGRTSGGPKDVGLLYQLGDLLSDFDLLLTPEVAEEVEAMLDEGPGHQGLARLTRYVGHRL